MHRGEVVNEQLETALISRTVIEQAKGVLAQHFGLDMTAAFDRLQRYSRDTNQRLGEVARRVVQGDLDLEELRWKDGRPRNRRALWGT